MFTPIADQHQSVCFLYCFVWFDIVFLGVFVLSLGLRCQLGVYRNIVRDVSFLYFGEHVQKWILVNMRRLCLYWLLTTLSKSVSSIWSIIQLHG